MTQDDVIMPKRCTHLKHLIRIRDRGYRNYNGRKRYDPDAVEDMIDAKIKKELEPLPEKLKGEVKALVSVKMSTKSLMRIRECGYRDKRGLLYDAEGVDSLLLYRETRSQALGGNSDRSARTLYNQTIRRKSNDDSPIYRSILDLPNGVLCKTNK